jgi:hypothetical protein
MFENFFFQEADVLRAVFLKTVLREKTVLKKATLKEAALREEVALRITREKKREEEKKNVFVFVLSFLSSINVNLIFL